MHLFLRNRCEDLNSFDAILFPIKTGWKTALATFRLYLGSLQILVTNYHFSPNFPF